MSSAAFDEFEDLKTQMSLFASQLEQYLGAKRARLVEDKQMYFMILHDLTNKHKKLSIEIKEEGQKEYDTKQSVLETSESLQLQQAKVDELRFKQSQLMETKRLLEEETNDLVKETRNIERELNKSEERLADQMKHDYPELSKFETYLGLKIEVIDIDLIRFVFTNLDPADVEKKYSIQLHIGDEDLTISESVPEISTEEKNRLESGFHEHKEILKFLKETRIIFKNQVK